MRLPTQSVAILPSRQSLHDVKFSPRTHRVGQAQAIADHYSAGLDEEALKGMMRRRHGRIIGITSVVGVTGNPGQGNYAAAKAGLVGMSKSLAAEVASRNITVNAIAPGFIQTAMTDVLTDAQKETIATRIPAGRMGLPAEIAAAA